MLALVLIVAVASGEGLSRIRRGRIPASPAGEGTLERAFPGLSKQSVLRKALDKVSWEARRVAADLLWLKVDRYVHEGYGRYSDNLDIVPLYRVITYLDPHFLEAYILAGLQLLECLGKEPEGIQMLQEGIAANRADPRVKELIAQLGVYYLKNKKNYPRARQLFEEALALVMAHGRRSEQPNFAYRGETLLGLLVVTCYRQGDLAAAARYSQMPHNLPPDHPIILELARSRKSAPMPAPSPLPDPDPARGHAGEGGRAHDHDHEHPGEAPARPRAAPVVRDMHRRPWMEADRMASLRRTVPIVVLVDLALMGWLIFRRRLACLALFFAVAWPAHAGSRDLPGSLSGAFTEYFLVFVVIVGVIIILVLNHLVRRGERSTIPGQEKLFGFIEEVLRFNPTDERYLEIGALCCENRLFDRALGFLRMVSSSKPDLRQRADFFEILALLGLSRLDEAEKLYQTLAVDKLSSADQYKIALAWKEHNLLSRAKQVFLRLFLTDIAFADVSSQLAEIESLEANATKPVEFVARLVSPRYREIKLLSQSESELACQSFDRDLARPVLLRVLRAERASAESVQRFLEEALSLSRLDHPAVLKVYDVQKDRLPYYSMESFDGRSLAEYVGGGVDAAGRFAILDQIVDLVRNPAGPGKAFGRLPASTLTVGAGGVVRVSRGVPGAGSGRSGPWADLRDVIDVLFPPGGQEAEYVRAGLDRIRGRLDEAMLVAADGSGGPEEGRAGRSPAELLESIAGEISGVRRFLNLTVRDQSYQAVLAHLRWLDDLHRAKIHALKSKFAICERYRSEPAKLVRSFFRPSNLEEILRLLDGLREMMAVARALPPCSHPRIQAVAASIVPAQIEEMAGALKKALPVSGTVEEPELKSLQESMIGALDRYHQFLKGLSLEISRLVEDFDLDLVRLVEHVVARSAYAPHIQVVGDEIDGRLRVVDAAEFKREFTLALENLISNSFEAKATGVEIVLGRTETSALRIVLQDDGSGVPDDLLQRIMTQRYTTKKGGTSTGVLSAKSLVEKHMGTFEIRGRQKTRGTEVTMLIPTA
ncbi:MAG: ATP-binding protein [Candidatus Riflebacteria bacterium]|nr:ATP-binding protein [Candidatus Riflebacteria bacterium]